MKFELVPVLCGAALRNKGIQPLLDAVVEYLPSPQDIPPIQGFNPETGKPESRRSSDQEPFSALAFKMMIDEGRKLTYSEDLLRGPAGRPGRLQFHEREAGKGRAPLPNACQQKGKSSGSPGRGHHRRSRA